MRGLLIRKRGKGTFVTNDEQLIQNMCLKHINMTSELLLPLKHSTTLSVEKEVVDPPAIIRTKLELNKKDNRVIRLVRDRLVQEGFRAFTINYLPYEIGIKIDKEALKHRSLLDIMETDLKIHFSEAFQTIEVSFADEETAKHLGIQQGNQTLLTERIMYADNSKPVEIVFTTYEANLYKSCLSLKKVKRGSSYDWICQITK